jgi:hypothetical protein
MWATLVVISQKLHKVNIAHSEVDVMITILCDFRQPFLQKIGVFLNNQCYDQIFAITGLF